MLSGMFRIVDVECSVQDRGCRVQCSGSWMSSAVFKIMDVECSVRDTDVFRIVGVKCRMIRMVGDVMA